MALPHLPASHIQPAFVHLRDRCPPTSPMLAELLEYFGTNWIDSTRRPPASWSTFKRVVRTNNDVEGWHYRLNNQAPHSRPNLYILVGLLHQEAALLPLQVKLVSQQKVYRRKRTEDRSKEQKLRALWDEYSTPDRVLSTAEYLRRISDLVDHTDNWWDLKNRWNENWWWNKIDQSKSITTPPPAFHVLFRTTRM